MWTTAVLWATVSTTIMSFPTPDEDRMMQPLSAAATGNYTISFMPLLTVLVNMFPRLLTRVRLQPLTTTTHARKLEALWEWERDSLCQMLEASGADDPCHFYTCGYNQDNHCPPPQESKDYSSFVNSELVTSTAIDECTNLEIRRCRNSAFRVNRTLGLCEQTNSPIQVNCQQQAPSLQIPEISLV